MISIKISEKQEVSEMNGKAHKTRSPNSVLAVTTISHMMQHIFLGTSILFPFIMAELNLNYTEFGIVIAISSLIGGTFQIVFSLTSRKVKMKPTSRWGQM